MRTSRKNLRRRAINIGPFHPARPALLALVSCAALGLLLPVSPASAQQPAAETLRKVFDVPAGPLEDALNTFARQASITLSFDPGLVQGKRAEALAGNHTVADGLKRLLAGSDLVVEAHGGSMTLKRAPRPESAREETVLPTVVVRGSAEASTEAAKPYAGGQVARGAGLGMLGTLDMMDTPFSVVSYTAKTVEDQQARTLADVLVNDASVRNFNAPSFPQDSFFVRGFQVDSADIGYGGLYGVMPLLRMSPAAAERIEVFKGPAAMLNGVPPFGSIGGNINIVPKRAGNSPLTQLTGSYAGGSQFGLQADVQRRFGDKRQFGLTFTGDWRDGETALRDNKQGYGQAVFGIDYRGSGLRLSADAGLQRQRERGIENGIFGVAPQQVPGAPAASQRIFQPWLRHENHDRFAVLKGEIDLNRDMTAFAALGARRHRYDELYAYGYPLDSNGNFGENFGYGAGSSNTGTVQAGLRSRFKTGGWHHELTTTATALSVARGVLYRFGAVDGGVDPVTSNIYAPVFVAEPSLAPLPDKLPKISESRLSSIAIADVMTPGDDRFSIVFGVRAQRIRVDNFDGAGALVDAYDRQAITPSLGVAYKLRPDVTLYGSYIEGLSQGPTAPTGTTNAGQVFPPTKTKQVEAGVKLDLGNLAVTAALFQMAKANGITNSSNTFTIDGEQRNRGLELNAFGEPLNGWRVLAGAMLLDAKLTKTEGGVNEGHRATDAAKANLNLGSEWDLPMLPGLTLSARLLHTGAVWIDQGNTQRIPAWNRIDIGARYTLQAGGMPVVLRASLENAADKSYWVNSSLYRGAPRTLLLSTTMAFQ